MSGSGGLNEKCYNSKGSSEDLNDENEKLRLKLEIMELKNENTRLLAENNALKEKFEGNSNQMTKVKVEGAGNQPFSSLNNRWSKEKVHPPEDLQVLGEKFMEGVNKYISKKRASSNYFRTYETWYRFLRENMENGYIYRTRDTLLISIRWEGPLPEPLSLGQYELKPDFIFTDNPYFPTERLNQAVLPVINEGWTDKRNKIFCCRKISIGFENKLNKEFNDPNMGKHCKLEGVSVDDGVTILIVYKTEKKPFLFQ